MRVIDLLRNIAGRLRSAGVEDAMFESKLMLASLLDMPPADLRLSDDAVLTEEQERRLEEWIDKRKSGYPLQYLFGEWEFMGLPFYTDPCALIPRADTEILAETAMGIIRQKNYRTVLDLCAGTGCIGISLAGLTGAEVTLSDISGPCCELILKNAARNGASVRVLCGDMFTPVMGMRFDCIVTNPPYIPGDVVPTLQREVSHEPRLALDGGRDGLDFYRVIAGNYRSFLNPGGTLLMEIGFDQGKSVPGLFGGGTVIKDYGGNDRVVLLSIGKTESKTQLSADAAAQAGITND